MDNNNSPRDTQAIFPMPPCEIREALAAGIAEAVARSYPRRSTDTDEDVVARTRDLILALFGDLNVDALQAPRTDGRFLNLQDAFTRAITIDNIASRLNHARLLGAPQKATIRSAAAEGEEAKGGFLLQIEFSDDESAVAVEVPAVAN